MSWSFALVVVVSALSTILALGLAWWVWRHPHPGSPWLALVLLAAAEWDGLRALEVAVVNPATKVACAKLEYVGIAAVPPLWLLFARAFSGYRPMSRRTSALLWLPPALTVGLALTNDRHGLIWSRITRSAASPGAPLIYQHGAAFWLAAGYNYLLVLAGSLLLLWSVVRFPQFHRRHVAALLSVALLPLLANILYLCGARPLLGLDPTPFGFTLASLLLCGSLLRTRLLDLVPVARATVLASMVDGVIVVDPSGYIADCNPAAHQLLGGTAAPLLGQHVQALVDRAPAVGALLERRALGPAEICVPGPDEAILEIRAIALPAAASGAGGTVLLLRDITARRRAEDQLRASAARYRAMFETNRAIKLVVDAASGRILEANPAACDFYGYSHAELTAMPIAAVNVWPAAEVRAAMDQAAREQRLSFIAPHRLASGEVRDVEVYSGPVEVDGHTMLYSIIHDVTERARAEAALQHQALHDALTGLPNRTLLQQRLVQALEAEPGAQPPLALLLLDLDRFKEINDTFGHHQGDDLLCAVARRLGEVVRASDLAARLGGDEFAVLLPTTDEQGAVRVATTLRDRLERPYELAGHTLHVGSSIGIALAPHHGADAHALLQCADAAMYAAKRAHAGHAVYEAAHAPSSAHELGLVGDLRQAIAQGELALVYQPKVDLTTGEVCGVEALVRWPHPTRGLIPPDRFIPLAEQTGLITPLTRWVLEAALAQGQRWYRMGQALGVAVNLSMWNLRDANLADALSHLLRLYAVPPQLLTLELTESALMADATQALEVLTRLREVGVRLAIDDFGTGYSSLAYLKRLPVDELKLDRSFVREMAEEAADQAIVAATVGLAHSLGLTVVAEGVEDAATSAALQALGCDQMQGYYVARPLPATEVQPWLRERAEQEARHRIA